MDFSAVANQVILQLRNALNNRQQCYRNILREHSHTLTHCAHLPFRRKFVCVCQ